MTLIARMLRLLAPFALAATSLPLHAAGALDNPAGPWRHVASGAVFPKSLSNATRESITSFNDANSDVGVNYVLRDPKGTLSFNIFVYPNFADISCRAVFDDARAHIDSYAGARRWFEGPVLSPSGTAAGSARLARYYIPAGAMREGTPAVVSDIYLYCPAGGKWLVKYRASWTGAAEDFPEMDAMLRQVNWSAALR